MPDSLPTLRIRPEHHYGSDSLTITAGTTTPTLWIPSGALLRILDVEAVQDRKDTDTPDCLRSTTTASILSWRQRYESFQHPAPGRSTTAASRRCSRTRAGSCPTLRVPSGAPLRRRAAHWRRGIHPPPLRIRPEHHCGGPGRPKALPRIRQHSGFPPEHHCGIARVATGDYDAVPALRIPSGAPPRLLPDGLVCRPTVSALWIPSGAPLRHRDDSGPPGQHSSTPDPGRSTTAALLPRQPRMRGGTNTPDSVQSTTAAWRCQGSAPRIGPALRIPSEASLRVRLPGLGGRGPYGQHSGFRPEHHCGGVQALGLLALLLQHSGFRPEHHCGCLAVRPMGVRVGSRTQMANTRTSFPALRIPLRREQLRDGNWTLPSKHLYRAERHPSVVGVPWDFSGTSGPIKRHEREIAERSFAQVSDRQPLIAAGHRTRWSLPGQLTIIAAGSRTATHST